METIKLWKENRLDQEYQLSIEEISAKFIESKYNDNVAFLPLSVSTFISNLDGLNSVIDGENYELIYKHLRKFYKDKVNYLK